MTANFPLSMSCHPSVSFSFNVGHTTILISYISLLVCPVILVCPIVYNVGHTTILISYISLLLCPGHPSVSKCAMWVILPFSFLEFPSCYVLVILVCPIVCNVGHTTIFISYISLLLCPGHPSVSYSVQCGSYYHVQSICFPLGMS